MERWQRKPLTVETVEWKGDNFDEVDALALKYGLDNYVSMTLGKTLQITSSDSGRVWIADKGDRVVVDGGPPASIYLSREMLFYKTYEPLNTEQAWQERCLSLYKRMKLTCAYCGGNSAHEMGCVANTHGLDAFDIELTEPLAPLRKQMTSAK